MLNKKFVSKTKYINIVFMSVLALLIFFFVSACAPSNYEKELKPAVLKTPDILQNGYLKVGVDFGNPPLAGETSKSAGIDIDIASAIGDQLGLQVEFVDIGSSPELAIANKKVDIVMGVSKSTSVDKLWKSEPYMQTACAIFANNANVSVPQKDTGVKISSQMGSSSALAVQAQFGADSVKFENSILKCFESLSKNEVSYVAGDAVIGTYTAKSDEIKSEIIALLTKPSGYCVACSNDNASLIEKITSALDTINKGGIASVIEKKWLGKALELDKVALTPEASNQADIGELDAGIYAQTDSNAPRDTTNF